MAAWVAILVQIAIAALSGFISGLIIVVSVRVTVSALSKGQDEIRVSMSEIVKTLAELSSNSAVNESQHAEISRRLSLVEQTLGIHAERIRVLRTRAHMNANKLMELDPGWQPYKTIQVEEE